MINRYIAIILGLMVVAAFFITPARRLSTRPFFFSLPSLPGFRLPSVESDVIKASAWNTFQEYLKAAKAHDLDKVRSLSHQTSATCLDSEKRAECEVLMDSVYNFAHIFKLADFDQVHYDDRQIVMMTRYEKGGEAGTQPVQVVLFFTRTPDGSPRVLGMRFCMKDGEDPVTSCVETDPSTRDLDQNGWWDAVEGIFYPA